MVEREPVRAIPHRDGRNGTSVILGTFVPKVEAGRIERACDPFENLLPLRRQEERIGAWKKQAWVEVSQRPLVLLPEPGLHNLFRRRLEPRLLVLDLIPRALLVTRDIPVHPC